MEKAKCNLIELDPGAVLLAMSSILSIESIMTSFCSDGKASGGGRADEKAHSSSSFAAAAAGAGGAGGWYADPAAGVGVVGLDVDEKALGDASAANGSVVDFGGGAKRDDW